MAPKAAAKPKLPRAPTITEEADTVLVKAEAKMLAPAIAKIESSPEVDLQTLCCLGMGLPAGASLAECGSATEAAKVRGEIAVALVKADRRLVKVCGTSDDEGERQQEVMLAVSRKVAMVVRHANAALMATPEKAKTVVRVESEGDKDGARDAVRRDWELLTSTRALLTRSYSCGR